MKAVRRVAGKAAPLARADVDTDAIIPQKWLITTEREGLGKGLFSNWRFLADGTTPDPEFVLNDPRYADAAILVTGPNYGCGSSREHAVWAHLDFGIAAIVAPSYGPIFLDNALKNGLVAVTLAEAATAGLLQMLVERGGGVMTVDLEERSVIAPDGRLLPFTMDEERRVAILAGRDDVGATLAYADDIAAFERRDRAVNSWAW